MLVMPALAFIVLPALAAYACAWIIKGGPRRLLPAVVTDAWTPWLLGLCLAIVAVVLCGYSLRRALKWRSIKYTLTSRRIIARFGMLRRGDWLVSLAAVRSVGVRQSLLQRMLRSGNISLDTGHPGETVLRDVPEVRKFRSFILDAMDDLPDGEIFEADVLTDFSDDALPWELREGGRDER